MDDIDKKFVALLKADYINVLDDLKNDFNNYLLYDNYQDFICAISRFGPLATKIFIEKYGFSFKTMYNIRRVKNYISNAFAKRISKYIINSIDKAK